jgi:hypothetical protein
LASSRQWRAPCRCWMNGSSHICRNADRRVAARKAERRTTIPPCLRDIAGPRRRTRRRLPRG